MLPARRLPLLWGGLLLLVAFRFWFAAVLPMTGDEAYFVLWGEHPAGGYYDHPPMVGWWLTGLLAVARAEWWLRLPAVLLPFVLAAGAWWLVRPQGRERAGAAALLVLLQPANVWNVLITTDTPVILFTLLSVLAYVAGLRAAGRGAALAWHGAAGALLGAAFLGKYFAALLGIAYLAHVACMSFARRGPAPACGRWAGFLALLAGALPAPLYNLWWNSGHCWVNILFNFMNRNEGAGFAWPNPPLYLASLAYLATPWLLFALWRGRAAVRAALRSGVEANAAWWLAAVPLGVFAAMSLTRSVGLHWLVSFMPLLAVLAAVALPRATLARLLRWSAAFAALHMALVVTVAALPLETWNKSRLYDGIVLTVRSDELLAELRPYADDYLFAMESYSAAATLAYNAARPFAVFGEGSFHARQDDFLTDWRAQDGRNVLILRKSETDAAAYAPFFRSVEVRAFTLHGVRFSVVLGQGFDYAVYHERVLKRVRERFYRIPAWLPQRGCEFCERYFPEAK